MNNAPSLQELLEEGFTERRAKVYLDALKTEQESGLFETDYMNWAHSRGFTAESAYAYNLSDENIDNYLSDYQIRKLWPLNDWQRIWINDKLTLNTMLVDSELEKYMPEYYYYTAANRLVPLRYSNGGNTPDDFIETLKKAGEMACKPCNGAMALGFCKMAYVDGQFLLNGKNVGEEGIKDALASMKNYLFTEFIRPEAELAKINSRIHTLRVLVINKTGSNPVPVAAYLRFATGEDGVDFEPNYVPPTEADIFSYNVQVDVKTGKFGNGKCVYAARVVDSPTHPTTGVPVDGILPYWPEVLEMINRICMKLGAVEYFGFDIGLTDKGPKVMEINSDSGIKYIQLFTPLMTVPEAAEYYTERLAMIEQMDAEQRAARNKIKK